MDITQLVITLASVVGIAVVGAMAVLPSALEVGAARDERRPLAPGPTSRRGAPRRDRPRAVDLAA